MSELCSRDRVKGYLRASGRKMVNGSGEEILLRGPGLGNWLLPEGYMWKFRSKRADRPRHIEQIITELTGERYSASFWQRFRDDYTTESDIAAIAKAGFNSIRIPLNARLLIEEGEGSELKEDGFLLIDRCLEWCKKHRLYAFIDMHGAPGGQTGANIDDSIDDKPRLLIDKHQYQKGIYLWEVIAKRYKDNTTVAGYDLLNEPLPDHFEEYIPKLMDFYTDTVKAIRAIDTDHMLSIEGTHWATKLEPFKRRYDDNMCIHFHRYWLDPVPEAYADYLKLSGEQNLPLWLGESGENTVEWYRAMFPLAINLSVSWNFWPWKRMLFRKDYLPLCEIKTPKDWQKIIDYIGGGAHPGYDESRKIFDEYLNNILFKNTVYHTAVENALLNK